MMDSLGSIDNNFSIFFVYCDHRKESKAVIKPTMFSWLPTYGGFMILMTRLCT